MRINNEDCVYSCEFFRERKRMNETERQRVREVRVRRWARWEYFEVRSSRIIIPQTIRHVIRIYILITKCCAITVDRRARGTRLIAGTRAIRESLNNVGEREKTRGDDNIVNDFFLRIVSSWTGIKKRNRAPFGSGASERARDTLVFIVVGTQGRIRNSISVIRL